MMYNYNACNTLHGYDVMLYCISCDHVCLCECMYIRVCVQVTCRYM